jgi:cytochrome c oxidase subunit 4
MLHAHVTAPKLVLAWLALLFFTFVSFGISRLGLGGWEVGIALGISVVKSLIVLFVFMHLVEQRFANRLIVILTFVFIVLAVALTTSDPMTRRTFPPRPDPAAHPYP